MVVLDAFGARWTLDVSGLEPSLGAELLRLWERARVDTGSDAPDARPFVVRRLDAATVEVNGQPVLGPVDDLTYAVSRAVTIASIARRTGDCLMLHAAGVSTADGATVALVASSGTGKTTASRVLGRALGYVSDETVAVEHDLAVRSYPKPLSLVVDPALPHTKRESSPDELGLVHAPRALSLATTVVLRRSPDAVKPVLEPISLVEAMGEVLPQTSALPSLDRPLDRLATALTAGHGPWRLTYRDIADCAGLVADLARQRFPDGPPHAVSWTWHDGTGTARTGTATGPTASEPPPDADAGSRPPAWTRAPFRDAVVSDGAALVMLDRVPVTLPGLAATLWVAAASPTTLDELVAATTASYGPHPDARALVTATLATLAERGVLQGSPAPVTPPGGSARPVPR